jgi:hypothetical protein
MPTTHEPRGTQKTQPEVSTLPISVRTRGWAHQEQDHEPCSKPEGLPSSRPVHADPERQSLNLSHLPNHLTPQIIELQR